MPDNVNEEKLIAKIVNTVRQAINITQLCNLLAFLLSVFRYIDLRSKEAHPFSYLLLNACNLSVLVIGAVKTIDCQRHTLLSFTDPFLDTDSCGHDYNNSRLAV